LHEALAAQDRDAFHEFVRTHRPAMMRLASEMLGNSDLAEEVVQDTFEVVFKDIGSFRGEASIKTWTFRILINRARRVGRRERRSIPFAGLVEWRADRAEIARDVACGENLVESTFHGCDPAADPQNSAIVRQRLQILAEGLRKLPHRQREIVILRDIEGHESAEVTEMLKISTGNQRVLLHRARAALRSELETRDGAGRELSVGNPQWN